MNERTAFVLAGGGSLGAIQVGMLRALLMADVRPDFVVGTSVGAINGAYVAADPTLAGVARLGQIWASITRRDVFPLNPLGAMRGVFGHREHLLEPSGLRRLLTTHFGNARLESLVLPCAIVASDVRNGAEVVLTSGPASDALMASASIPVLLPAVRVGGRDLVDGAIANNAPISTALAMGASRVIVLPTGFTCATSQPPSNAIAMVLHTMTLLVARQLVYDVERLGARAPIAIVPPLCPLPVSAYDFSQAALLEDRAAEATGAWIRDGGLESSKIPVALGPHEHVM